MFLVINGTEKIECTKAEKGNDYINLYDESNSVFRTLKGIPDFNKFSVEGGEFSEPPLDEITQVQLAIAELAELVIGGAE